MAKKKTSPCDSSNLTLLKKERRYTKLLALPLSKVVNHENFCKEDKTQTLCKMGGWEKANSKLAGSLYAKKL